MNPIYNVIAVGARSFGKTSLVGAIKGVPGFSPVVGRQRVEDFRRDSIIGESSPTQKKDGITVWKFESRRDKYFRLNIFDCAGEFFKDEEEDGIGRNSDDTQKSSGKWLSFDNWQNRFRSWKLDRTIRQIDAMLVLLPANWEGIDRQDLDAYVAKVCRWIRQRRDRFPVWFVVNKCDVLDDEDLAKIKEDADIRNLIEGSKLQKTYRAIRDAISVDGEHEVHFGIISVYPRTQKGWTKPKDNADALAKSAQLAKFDDLSEDEAAPFNVRALLMEIADVADRERGNNFVKAWDVAPWWKRMFLHPFMCLSVVGKGSSDKDLYKKMRGIRWGAWLRFCSFAFGLALVAAATILAAASIVEWREESKFEKALAENKKALPEVTRDRLIQYDDYLASNIWIRPVFFQPRLSKLREKLVDLKTNYVNWLEKDLRDELRDARNVRMDYWDVAPSNNIERAKARTEAVKGHLDRLPRDCRSACIESNQVEEAKYISDFTNDIEFIKALYALRSVERRDKCREMVRIQKEHNDKRCVRTNDFERLNSEIRRLELEFSNELSNRIARIERNNSGETWEDKTNRYTKTRDFVMSNLAWFVEEGDVFKRWKEYAEKCGSAILRGQKYGPFEDDFRTNVMARSERQRVKPMEKFLREHTPEMYPLYTNRLNEIAKDMKRINDMLFDELTNKLENIRTDAAARSWQYQEKAATNRIALIEEYMNLVDEATCEKLGLRKEKENAFKIIVGRTGKFDEEYEALMETSDRRFLHQAMKFRDDFNQKDFQDRADCYTNIFICETNLIARVAATNNCQIAAWPEPAATNFEARLVRSRKIQECCEDALEYFPAGHEGAALYSNQVQRARVEATQCTRWITIRKSMEAIKEDAKSEPKIRLLKIGSFFEKYSKKDNVAPELVWIYDEIGGMQRNAESEFDQTIEGKLSQLQIKGTEKDNLMQEVLKKKIEVFKNALQYLVKDSEMANTYKNRLASEIKRLSDEEKAGVFRRDCDQLKKDIVKMNPVSKIKAIDDFLRSHPKNIFVSLGFADVYARLEKDREQFKIERDWEIAKSDVEAFLKGSVKSKEGDDGFRSEMRDRRNKAEGYKTQISRYVESIYFASEARMLMGKLQKEIEVINQSIRIGGWPDILESEKRYKRVPSEVNYKVLKEKLEDFGARIKNPENPEDCKEAQFADSFHSCEERVNRDWSLYQKVNVGRAKFKQNPSQASFTDLANAVTEYDEWNNGRLGVSSGYGAVRDGFKALKTFTTQNSVSFTMELLGYDFSETDFRTYRNFKGKIALWVYTGGKPEECTVAIDNVPGVKCDDVSNAAVIRGASGLKINLCVHCGDAIQIELVQWGNDPDTEGRASVDVWSLLALTSNTFKKKIEIRPRKNIIMYGREHSNRPATLEFRFSGVPVCP